VEERLRAVIDFVWRPYTTRVHTRARARARALIHTSAINDIDCAFCALTKAAYILTICPICLCESHHTEPMRRKLIGFYVAS